LGVRDFGTSGRIAGQPELDRIVPPLPAGLLGGRRKRRKKAGVPDSIQFQTKLEIGLDQIRRARERGLPQGVVLADTG
jgi:hypothetical protein